MAKANSYTLKTFFSPALVQRLGADLARTHPPFPKRAFVRDACTGLDELELLDRGKHIAAALEKHLPRDYPDAVELLLRSLGPELSTDELIGIGMAPFFYLPHMIYVSRRGLDHFDLSMNALHALTKRFSAEAAIRPFIAGDPERTFAVLRKWARDPNAHVRRLVSEGTRLRLPWAPRVPWLDANPTRVIELLERLKDDKATMVRRSVANSLNDLGKVHRDLLARTCRAWIDQASRERRALVEHALRSAVRRGEPQALRLLGYGKRPAVSVEGARIEPRRVKLGGRVVVQFSLRSASRRRQDLLVDLAVHFVKSNGGSAPKVFKLKRLTLEAGGTAELAGKVSLAPMTTRQHYAGQHRVEVIVNGVAYPVGEFVVQ
jgi:3-methyladenine DNA glycosylase AlkC